MEGENQAQEEEGGTLTQPLPPHGPVSPTLVSSALLSSPPSKASLWRVLTSCGDAFGFPVSYTLLHARVPQLVAQLPRNPAYFFEVVELGIGEAQAVLLREGRGLEQQQRGGVATHKAKVRARLVDVPPSAPFILPSVSAIRVDHSGGFIGVSGTLLRLNPRRLVERERVYKCAECKFEFMVKVDVMHDNTVSLPPRCPNPA